MRAKTGCLFGFLAFFAGNAFYALGRPPLSPGVNGALLAAAILLNLIVIKALCFRFIDGRQRKMHSLRGMNLLILFFQFVCFWILLKSLWGLLAPLYEHAAAVISHPLAHNAMEGRETVKAWLLGHGTNLYPALADHPFLVTIYPPGYQALVAAFASFSGWSIVTGRIVSFTCFLLITAMASAFTWRSTSSILASIGAASFLLFTPAITGWSLHARPDMLTWLAALAGAWCFFESCRKPGAPDALEKKRSALFALAAALLFCMALAVKQQSLPYLLGSLLWGAGRRAWRPVFITTLLAFLLGGMAILAAQAATDGHFLRNTLVYPAVMSADQNLNSPYFLLQRLEHIWGELKGITLLTAAYAAWAAWNRRWDLPGVLLGVNAVFMCKLLATWGADINYIYGTLIAAVLAVGIMLGRVSCSRPYGPAVAFTVLFAWLPASTGHDRLPPPDTSWTQGVTGNVLASTEGGQLFLGSDDMRAVTFYDAIETQLYGESGMWEAGRSKLVQDIRAGRFDHLVIYGDFSPAEFKNAVAIHYDIKEKHGAYTVHVPGKAELAAEVDPSGSWRTKGDWRAAGADVTSLHRETEGYAPRDRTKPARASFSLEAAKSPARVEARLSVLVSSKDQRAFGLFALKDASGEELARAEASPGRKTDIVLIAENPGTRLELVAELGGDAWIVPANGALAVLRGFE
jgi:hypothetical protein